MLAEAGNGGWEQQQLQQRPSKPLPLLANASAGGWQRQLWRRQLSGPTPLPAEAGNGGGHHHLGQRPYPRKRVMGGVIKFIIYLDGPSPVDGPKRWDYDIEVYTTRVN